MPTTDRPPEEIQSVTGHDARLSSSRGRQPGVTELLHRWSNGDETALSRLVPLVYDELRDLARRQLRGERSEHTLRGTALVHETFMRLVKQRVVHLESRAQFFGWAAQLMRRILVNHARDRRAGKRGGGAQVHSLEALQDEIGEIDDQTSADRLSDVLALDEALHRMERIDPRKSQVVELRFFGGLSVEETAQAMDMSPSTVTREWATARAWLLGELGAAAPI